MAVYCPNCGKRLPDYAAFCDECGTRIPAQNHESYRQDSSHERVREEKKPSLILKILKWIVILAVIGGIVLFALSFLESIYHRTPPEDVKVQETVSTEQSSGTAIKETAKPAGDQNSIMAETPGAEDTSQGSSEHSDVWFDEFLFYENDVYKNGVPDGAVLHEADYIDGEWKYCITFNRKTGEGERVDEIGTAVVGLPPYGAQLFLNPKYIRYGSEVKPETAEEAGYGTFSGTWDPAYIDLSDEKIYIGLGPFYTYEGKDYVLGNIVIKESGKAGDFLLVRP